MSTELHELEGWNSEKEVGQFLATLIEMTKAKTVLEVGVFQGNSSNPMLEALPKGGQFVGIDIEDLRTEANKKNWNQKGKSVDFIEGSSHKELKRLEPFHFDLIFVDAAHHWDHILPEFKLVEKLLAHGGVIAYHDSMHIEDVKELMKYAKFYGWNVVTIKTPELRGLSLLTRNL